jgi:hypothetical protein
MSDSNTKINHRPLIVIGLAMALGPLTALSLGSRYADEDTLARAQAGAQSIERRRMESQVAIAADDVQSVPVYAADVQVTDGGES